MVSLVIPLSLYHTPDVLVADSANVTRRIIDDVDVRLFGRLLLEDLYRRGPCQQHYRRLAVRAVSLEPQHRARTSSTLTRLTTLDLLQRARRHGLQLCHGHPLQPPRDL